jgi:diacylglycerol kinase (ATP)
MSTPQHFSLRALIKSFAYAIEGIAFTVRTQRNMAVHVLAAIIVCGAGWLLEIRADDWRWLCVSIGLVWCAELINSAIEFLCDIVMPQHHESVKRAKDIAAGAVLVCALIAVIIGVLTFYPYLTIMFH